MFKCLTAGVLFSSLFASSHIAYAMSCKDLFTQKNHIEILAENINSKSPQEVNDLLLENGFKPFKSEAVDYLKSNVGKEQLQGMRVAIFGGYPGKFVIGDIVDVWSFERRRYFVILKPNGKLEEISFDTEWFPFSAPMWGSKEKNPRWNSFQQRSLVTEKIPLPASISPEFAKTLKASLPTPTKWVDFNSMPSASYSGLIGHFVAGVFENAFGGKSAPEVFGGLVTGYSVRRGNGGGYDDYIELRITPLNGESAKNISFNKLDKLPVLFVYKTPAQGGVDFGAPPSAQGGNSNSTPAAKVEFKGPLF